MLHICRRPYVRRYRRKSLEIVVAEWVMNLRGETCAGSGEAACLYFKKGRKRWMKSSWKNMLLRVSRANFDVILYLLHDKDIG